MASHWNYKPAHTELDINFSKITFKYSYNNGNRNYLIPNIQNANCAVIPQGNNRYILYWLIFQVQVLRESGRAVSSDAQNEEHILKDPYTVCTV